MRSFDGFCRMALAFGSVLALGACSSTDSGVPSSEEVPTSVAASSGSTESPDVRTTVSRSTGPSSTGPTSTGPSSTEPSTTEPSTTEPSSTTASALPCAALHCDERHRVCEEGSGDADALCTICLEGYGEVGDECRPIPAAPEGLHTSTEDPQAVTLSWDAVPGATSYRVYRDGDVLAEVASPGYVDTTADAPTRPGVQDLAAAGHLESVVLSWTAPASEAGRAHSYEVSALAELESARSGAADGRRAAWSLLDYRIEVEEEEPVFVSALGWTDTEAPGPELAGPLALTTSQGTRVDAVELTVMLPEVLPGPARLYAIAPRWGSTESPVDGASAQVSGGRTMPPEVEVLVERSDGDSWVIVAFSDPVTAPYPLESTLLFEDASAPADGSSRTYRAQAVGTGLEAASQSAEGWRMESPTLGVTCVQDGDCSNREWCPTDTSLRRCSPRPEVEGVALPFQFVPSGTFSVGSPAGEVGRRTFEGQETVTLTRDYFVQRTPVTQGQWEAVMSAWNALPEGRRRMSGWSGATPEFGTAPAYFALPDTVMVGSNCDLPSCPVESVSWWDAAVYANVLSALEGLEPCYTLSECGSDSGVGAVGGGCGGPVNFCSIDAGTFGCGGVQFEGKSCSGYRLLTEAEWERAARAGTLTATYAGNLSSADGCVTVSGQGFFPSGAPLAALEWYDCNSEGRTHPVGSKLFNAWGLQDMLGNVSEWLGTRHAQAQNEGTDPLGPESGTFRRIRGGDWRSDASNLRAADRGSSGFSSLRNRFTGFRLARSH